MRTIKKERFWINENDNLEHLVKSLIAWFGEYNQNYLHSKLHYKRPMEFEAKFKLNFAKNTL